MKKQKGFSLIELLIVVAIILIIAAIAIPNLLRARIAANEVVGGGVDSDIEHSTDFIQLRLPDGGLFEHAGQSLGQLRGNHCADLDERLLDR